MTTPKLAPEPLRLPDRGPALERWRARCARAHYGGEGLPDRGPFLFRNPDRRLLRGILKAVAVTATSTDPLEAIDRVHGLARMTSDALLERGLLLAAQWLDEERAFECFRQNGTREGGAS
jgi:hypothetical protein